MTITNNIGIITILAKNNHWAKDIYFTLSQFWELQLDIHSSWCDNWHIGTGSSWHRLKQLLFS